MRSFTHLVTATILLLGVLPVAEARPQYGGGGQQSYNNNSDSHRNRGRFDQGLRSGGRGGEYYDQRHEHDGYNRRNDQYYRYGDERHARGGIGPGKGALIGGGGGALLGGLLGGGLKGALIGGAAGAGVGAIAGKVHQDHRRDQY